LPLSEQDEKVGKKKLLPGMQPPCVGRRAGPDSRRPDACVMLNEGVLQIRIKLVSFVVFWGVMD